MIFSKSKLGTVGPGLVRSLKTYAQSRPSKRARICMHEDESDRLHEMLIAAPRHAIWPPHRNDSGPKSWLIFEGAIAIVIFDENHDFEEHWTLDANAANGLRFLRLSGTRWHTILPLSESAVYLETALGPYRKTTFADWGPQMYGDREADRLIQWVETQ